MGESQLKLEILKGKFDRCIQEFIKYLNYLHSCRSDENLITIDYYGSIIDELKEGIYLIEEFNKLDKSYGETKICKIIENLETGQADKLVQNMREVLRELETAQDYLSYFLKTKEISEKEETKIQWAEEELEKLKRSECDLDILQNLEEALNEGNSGHYLACGIISARIIDHILHTLKKKESLPDENLNENLIIRLRELGILKEDKIAGHNKKEFLDAAKSARDAVSHKIEFMPNGPKAFSLLSYAFIISDLFVKYMEIRKNGEN